MCLLRPHRWIVPCLAAFALGAAAPPRAAVKDVAGTYAFRTYGPDQGLRNQAVTSLGQDKDGFIYAGTEDGLFRYDGVRFERFGAADGLPSDGITLLCQEPGGRLWVATQKGLVAWAGRKADPAAKGPFLPEETVEGLSASASGHLVVATAKGVYEGGTAGFAPIPGLPTGSPWAAWIAPDGSETLAATQGILYRRQGSGPWASRALAPGFRNEGVQALVKDGHGRIWLRGRRTLLRLASFEGPAQDLSGALPGAAVQKGFLVPDAQGRIWAPTNLGLACFEGDVSWVLPEGRGLPSQWATNVLVDREGNLWVASEGVHRLQGRLAWTAQTRRQKLPSDTVWGIFRSREGTLWTGTNRGLAETTAQGWTVVPGTQDRSFYAFAESPDGGLWVGGNNAKEARNALLYRAPGSRAFTAVPVTSIEGPSTVNSLAFGPDGALYIATMDHGMHRMVRKGAGFEFKAVAVPGSDGKEQINQLVQDARGRLWGAGMAGLLSFDGSAWRRLGLADGLRELQIEALALDPQGDLWVSYWNVHGLTRFTPAGTGLKVAAQVDGPPELVGDNIYSFGFDARGTLWLGTAQGMKRWKDNRMEQFGRGEGLPGEDAAANAFWADRNGDVWFGMANGLAQYHAGQDPAPPPGPTTQVVQVQDGAGRALETAVPKVGWSDRALTFRFSALSFLNEARVRCQVRLAGFEDTWRSTEIREARYTGLPPGRYRFEVRAAYGMGPFGEASAREVIILAPWWRTRWAMGLGAAGFATLLVLFYRWRTRILHRRNAQLETLVQARTLDLEKANAALQEASMVDPLTGLKNRRFLGLSMPEELARVNRQHRVPDRSRDDGNTDLLFFMVDLDHFKNVNDTYGHAAGDQVLKQASDAIQKACRESDIVVRWGGEEFLIVARNADRAHAGLMAGNLRKAVRDLTFDVGHGVVLRKTCSIGFSAFPVVKAAPELQSWEEAVELADQCLYAAKQSGRDAWVGVLVPDESAGDCGRLFQDVGGLAQEGKVRLLTSLPEGTPIRWKS